MEQIDGSVLARNLREATAPVAIRSTHVTGVADLSNSDISVPVELHDVSFESKLDLSHSRFRAGVRLLGCRFAGVDADSARFDSDLTLNCSSFSLTANFRDLQLDGALTARALTVSPYDDETLRFNRARFGKTVELQGTFRRAIDLRGARIGGNLRLAEWSVLEAGAHLDGIDVAGDLRLDKCRFDRASAFTGARIGGQLGCSGTEFNGGVTFDFAHVAGLASFESTVFRGGPATWRYCQLENEVMFIAHFHEDAEFRSAEFGGEALFHASSFEKRADFSGATFRGIARFGAVEEQSAPQGEFTTVLGAEFLGEATFKDAVFERTASFAGLDADSEVPPLVAATPFEERIGKPWGTRAAGMLSFRGARFFSIVDLGHTRFSQLDLSHARFEEGLDLHAVIIDAQLSLESVTTDRLRVPDQGRLIGERGRWKSARVQLDAANFETFEGDWEGLLECYQPYDKPTLQTLERALRTAGEEGGADWVHIRRRERERQKLRASRQWRRFIPVTLYGWLANYGVRPFRLFWIAAFLLVVGTVVFARPGAVVREDPSGLPVVGNLPYGTAFGEALDAFLPIDVPEGDPWEPTTDRVPAIVLGPFQGPWLPPRLVATILTLAGWILVPVGIAALTGLLKRTT